MLSSVENHGYIDLAVNLLSLRQDAVEYIIVNMESTSTDPQSQSSQGMYVH